MERREFAHIVAAVLLMFLVAGVRFVIQGDVTNVLQTFVFSIIIVGIPVIVKNAVAYSLDASVEHRVWSVYRFGVRPKEHFKKEQPAGFYVPLFFGLISLGAWKVMTFLSYETSALKHRAARRFGAYSFTSMTDWHNGLIGAAGVVALWIIAILAYLPGAEYLAKMATYYAFWNLVPISDLDGTQIYFGSRVLWTILAVTTLIFVAYALFLPA